MVYLIALTMKKTGVNAIIHIFALLHAITALCCRLAGIEDELLLTILTMTMTLLICMKRDRSIEYTAASIIIVNIIGYLLGNAGAAFFSLLFTKQYLINSLSTFATTEILGWGMVGFLAIFRKGSEAPKKTSGAYKSWILVAMLAIFVLRLGIIFLFAGGMFSGEDMLKATNRILSNSVALIIMICVNLLYIRGTHGLNGRLAMWAKLGILVAFVLAASFFEALMVHVGLPPDFSHVFGRHFMVLAMASFIAEITIFCIVFMVNEAVIARNEMKRERDKANTAQFRYLKLKRQVNPHFLFNSLNVLDCLVCENRMEQASTYIHKLAGVYRYMIKSEEEEVVPLREELVFVGMYIDLIKVRFPEGFDAIIDVPEKDKSRMVLPCSLQLLIENATKHNAVSAENPLIIKVSASGDNVTVCNNIIPKVTKSPSTGLGQKYIRQRYLDLSGKSISIEQTSDSYCVTLPLL